MGEMAARPQPPHRVWSFPSFHFPACSRISMRLSLVLPQRCGRPRAVLPVLPMRNQAMEHLVRNVRAEKRLPSSVPVGAQLSKAGQPLVALGSEAILPWAPARPELGKRFDLSRARAPASRTTQPAQRPHRERAPASACANPRVLDERALQTSPLFQPGRGQPRRVLRAARLLSRPAACLPMRRARAESFGTSRTSRNGFPIAPIRPDRALAPRRPR